MMAKSIIKKSSLLDIQSVAVGYDRPLHQPLNFRINTGDLVLLSGENGAGKSSFIKALAGQVSIIEGNLRRANGLRVGLQAQQPVQRADFPLTVIEYLHMLDCTVLALPQRLAALQRLAIAELSYGQMHLLAIWSTIHSPAQLVLLDEPTNHLDAEARLQVAAWLGDLRADQAALVVSHDDILRTYATQQVEVIARCRR